jgi:NADP-dependent alcohol dehydrogenase
MLNFTYQNPTKILFGKGQIANIPAEIPAGAKVLLTYGGGSIHRNGVYEQIRKALAGHTVVEFGGIEPNPEYKTLMKAVDIGRREKVDLLLAAGGGSVLDGTKFIGAAIPFEGEPWEILSKHAPVTTAVPLAAVLTLPATGSESNSFAVISRAETGQKLAFSSTFGYPVFSVLDPEVTYSLPPRQVANGVVDAFVHTIEQYLTFPVGARLQDRFAESILQTLIEVGPQTLARPTDYDLRANFVWAATMALNGLIGQGVPQDWSTHMIGHELTALYGIDHARTLACVLPDLLRVQSKNKAEKLLQYAERIWGVREGSPEQRMEAGIAATEKFFESLGVPTRLKAYGQVKADTPDIVAHRLTANGMTGLGERQEVTPEAVEKILELSLA